ncbi:FmdB family zinc ribbon protein [Planctomicrobium sp. SH664]|uniref:FmdB family zinc ribbon protein n=1 Tax=Planctomicrobium sp. SH664 TaxID=3448125 RepID=UPI003F5BFC6B
MMTVPEQTRFLRGWGGFSCNRCVRHPSLKKGRHHVAMFLGFSQLQYIKISLAMPIYEYRCTQCGSESEIFVRAQASPECPNCSSQKLEKLMSAPAGHVAGNRSLPISGGACPPMNAPLCHPNCCRAPQH